MMVGGIDSVKHAQWRRRMERFERSDESVVAFCRAEGVSTASFYHWRRKLAERVRDKETADGVSSRFTAVRVIGSPNVAAQLPGGMRLEIPTGDVQVLRLVIDTLARVDAERAGESLC